MRRILRRGQEPENSQTPGKTGRAPAAHPHQHKPVASSTPCSACDALGTEGDGIPLLLGGHGPIVQRRCDAHRDEHPNALPLFLRAAGRPLPEPIAAEMGSKLGDDFDQVRVHDDTAATESARALGATAFTVGRDVAFAPGAYAPETESGRPERSRERRWRWELRPLTPEQAAVLTFTIGTALLILLIIALAPVGA